MFSLQAVNILKVIPPTEGKKSAKVVLMDMNGREDKPMNLYVPTDTAGRYKEQLGKQIKQLNVRVQAYNGTIQLFPQGEPVF